MEAGTIERWKRHECRTEQGIFFAAGDVVLLKEAPEGCYESSVRTSIDNLVAASPDDWFFVDPAGEEIIPGYHIVFGGGSWEGEGFVALERKGALVWILHLSDKERFTSVRLEGRHLRAVSGEYPDRFSWVIPLDEPEKLRYKKERV